MRPFDAMIVEDSTCEKLVGSSREETVAETVVRLPSLPSLIALKLHALRHGGEHRRGRDLSDVATLVQVNHIDLADEQFIQRLLTELETIPKDQRS